MPKKQNMRVLDFCKNKIIATKDYFFSRRFIVLLWSLLLLLLVCYFVLLFFAKNIEIALTFPGWDINLKEITNHPAGLIVAEEVEFTSSEWEQITWLYINNNSKKVVYYFHGNGAPLPYFYSDVQYISDLWYSVMALEYPGYWDSTWKPYIETNTRFTREFYEHMQALLWFQDENVVIWWYSIGTALAVEFAKDRDFDSLVLFSPLASRHDMWSKLLWFPIQYLFFLPNSYISKESIRHIEEPTLIVHGNTDKVVAVEQWMLLHENSWAEKKYFIEIDDFGHSLIPERYGEVLEGSIRNFLASHSLEEEKFFLDRKTATEILKRYRKEKKIFSLDLETDSSLTKFVNPNVSFKKKGYIPEGMKRLSRDYVIDTKGNAKMIPEAANAFELLARDFYKEFDEKIVVVSSYRSYAYQAWIKARGCPDNLCAKAWYSEHQSGLTADLWSASTSAYWQSSTKLTKFYTWLDNNAHNYWFHNTYQKGREIDGYEIEPWHWRYLWADLAKYLKENNLTFAEFYHIENKK